MRALSIVHYPALTEIWKVSHNNQAKLQKYSRIRPQEVIADEKKYPSETPRKLFCSFL